MQTLLRPALFSLALSIATCFQLAAAPEAFEIGPDNKDQLPRGKEADGIIGDFVLRNRRVEAVISANVPLRRANMSTFYGTNGVTPGCLYDLTLRGANNDQIVVFTPSGQQGFVSYVRVAKDGRDGEAVIETVISAAMNNGVYKRHEYRLRDDWQGLLIVTTMRNDGKTARKGTVEDRWTKFATNGVAGDITWADAEDPADKCGYAYAWIERDGMKAPPKEIEIKPGEQISFARFLAVGTSPAEALGVVAAQRGAVGYVSAKITNPQREPLPTVRVWFSISGKNIVAYPDALGKFKIQLPPDSYEVEVEDFGAKLPKFIRTVKVGEEEKISVTMFSAPAIFFDIRDELGKSIPCKVQFKGIDGTPSPQLGPQNRAHGCVDQYHSERGDFRVNVPEGEYEVVVTHGIEFSHLKQRVRAGRHIGASVKGTLIRLVDTRGWVSADYHNHSTPSGDNTCGTDDRIINLAAEHIEFAPTTEHNRLYDWRPHIERLGLAREIQTVSGMELTGGGAHFNSFPFTPEPFTQDNGAPVWSKDPRITAVTLRNHQGENPDRWIQINHPDMVENFIDRDGDGREDGGFLGLPSLIDGVETQNYSTAQILSKAPFTITRDIRTGKESVNYLREFIWLQLLNRGHRYWGMAVCDAHTVYGNGVGGWRMYMPSSTDEPALIDWKENSRNARAGRSILTSGPFLEVKTEDGTLAGGQTRAIGGGVKLRVKVQCTDWLDIDRVQVLVNGRQRADLNFTRASHPEFFQNGVVKFDREITVPLSQDSHLIVVAIGENSDLSIGYGTSGQAKIKPCAYNNPIFVDVDGGGFTPNGDTLGWPLPVKKLNVDEVKKQLANADAKPAAPASAPEIKKSTKAGKAKK
ncbi:MAG: CehA/McbA family metallohydrolase [Verrucomicrobia bacterium]|nr:CehA/McbA family metallohydrolase [Verrucomicrobiota bacterium]